ncbi:MAG TPA: type I methionyl aminopeptidase [Gammaproteobacteria bacterium]|nr:type I methionyl aminopeptidase [Gammaproteobacteria bacterium]
MSKVNIKSPAEVELMRHSGKLLAQVFSMLDEYIKTGVSTMEINDLVEAYIVNTLNAIPASKGQYGYEFVLNTSVNETVCHGVPSTMQRLKSRDIVNVDITLSKNGFIADSSKMYVLEAAGVEAKRLVNTTYEALWKAIRIIKPGVTLGDIGYTIQTHAEAAGYSVVKEYCGHGIGREMHEAPQVMHFGRKGSGLKLQAGMIFTIEPMINQGKAKVKTKKDGWTVLTKDKKLSAQWEHTVLVTESGFEVLTLRDEEGIG